MSFYLFPDDLLFYVPGRLTDSGLQSGEQCDFLLCFAMLKPDKVMLGALAREFINSLNSFILPCASQCHRVFSQCLELNEIKLNPVLTRRKGIGNPVKSENKRRVKRMFNLRAKKNVSFSFALFFSLLCLTKRFIHRMILWHNNDWNHKMFH